MQKWRTWETKTHADMGEVRSYRLEARMQKWRERKTKARERRTMNDEP
jgi:hypothetical protein